LFSTWLVVVGLHVGLRYVSLSAVQLPELNLKRAKVGFRVFLGVRVSGLRIL
jgi:hypothetical protein